MTNIGLMMVTSLNILLLAFFIMLSAQGVVDEKRKIEAMGSVLGAFGILPGGLSTSEDSSSGLSPQTSPLDEITQDMDMIREVMANQIVQDKVHILTASDRQIISLESAMLFPPDGVEIMPAMKEQLLQIAKILKGSPYPIIIEGHTDDQPPRTEEFKDNWEISALRATNVLRFFAEQGGIKLDRMTAYGYAGNKPAVANTNPRNRERNNRIDLVLDNSQRKLVKDQADSRRQDKTFDFKGFNFRLFKEKKD